MQIEENETTVKITVSPDFLGGIELACVSFVIVAQRMGIRFTDDFQKLYVDTVDEIELRYNGMFNGRDGATLN